MAYGNGTSSEALPIIDNSAIEVEPALQTTKSDHSYKEPISSEYDITSAFNWYELYLSITVLQSFWPVICFIEIFLL